MCFVARYFYNSLPTQSVKALLAHLIWIMRLKTHFGSQKNVLPAGTFTL